MHTNISNNCYCQFIDPVPRELNYVLDYKLCTTYTLYNIIYLPDKLF